MTDYGRGMYALTSIKSGRKATGRLLVGQAVCREIATKKGTLPRAPNYGFGIPQMIGKVVTEAHRQALERGLERDIIARHPRVKEVDVAVTRTVDGIEITYTIEIHAVTAYGTFDLVMTIADAVIKRVGLT